jgi:hypothetical protein
MDQKNEGIAVKIEDLVDLIKSHGELDKENPSKLGNMLQLVWCPGL